VEDKPHRFNMQIRASNLLALHIPPKMKPILVMSLQIQFTLVTLPLKCTNFCEYGV
jgi:hypothetical protein